MNVVSGLFPSAELVPLLPTGATSTDPRVAAAGQPATAQLTAIFAAVLAEAIAPQLAVNVESQLPAGAGLAQPEPKGARREAKNTPLPGAPLPANVAVPATPLTMSAATEALRALVEDVAGEAADAALEGLPERKDAGSTAPVSRDDAGAKVVPDAAALSDPTIIVRDLTSLQPQFRTKVERVIERMKAEFGHDVTVTETWRSQARQDRLHEMGRTQPGAIVTWTRHSRHAEGRAADLMVDGRWDNAEGYRALMQVAREEGLQTVGWQDPGHVEMSGEPKAAKSANAVTIEELGVSGPQAAAVEQTTSLTQVMRPSQVASAGPATRFAQVAQANPGAQVTQPTQYTQVGQVAEVSRVAQVATVAEVAQVAQVAHVASVARVAQGGPAASAQQGTAPPALPTSAQAPGSSHEDRRRDDGDKPRESPSVPVRASDRANDHPSADATRDVTSARAGVPAPGARVAASSDAVPVHALDAAGRAARVLDLQDARSAQPASHVLLRIDDADGGQDRIRVDLRGASVGTTMDVRNPETAQLISNRMHELTAALESRGLEAESLRVRATASAGSTLHTDLARVVAAGGDAQALRLGTLFADGSPSSSRSRGDSQGQRPQQDPSRHRSRREQKEGTQ